ncbi:MAG: hypothetical protein HW411_1178 [Gammaproteobacteria bacterium]|nr:hypothetical protein [Gammaproteobacteria bacterium]
MSITGRRTIFTLFGTVVVLLSVFGCSEKVESALHELQQQIATLQGIKNAVDNEFSGESGVHINNGMIITVSLVNTSLNDMPFEKRLAAARQVVQIVNRLIHGKMEFQKVSMLVVAFVRHERHFFIVNFTNTVDFFQFGKDTTSNFSLNPGIQQTSLPPYE